MEFSHIPAYACYLLTCCCASLSRTCTFLPGSNHGLVSPFPPLHKSERAHWSPLPAYALRPSHHRESSTALLHVYQHLFSAVSPGQHTRSGLTIAENLWRIPSPCWCNILLHECTSASWPNCFPPGSQGIFCRGVASWLAPACPTAGLCPFQWITFTVVFVQQNLWGSHQPVSPACPVWTAALPFSTFWHNPAFGVFCKYTKSAAVQPII